ncbi:conserved exported hypothetical protein [Tenacibaculum sp. 190524A02b]|uniref:Uncharacterized protein n=1 Tax=Tenacibaculum vairaonense TaxID=3137860 RepID=A0ABM9PHX3_9FLAO
MKAKILKLQLAFLVLFSSILFSCSDKDVNEIQNSAPDKPMLDITWSDIGNTVFLSWSKVEDRDKDNLTYEVYINNEKVKVLEDKEAINDDFNYFFSIREEMILPMKVKVLVSDGKLINESDIKEVKDPIIGKWILGHVTVIEKGYDDAEILMPQGCEKNTSREFKINGDHIFNSFTLESNGDCDKEVSMLQWRRIGLNKYEFVSDMIQEFDMFFDENTMQYKVETTNELSVYFFKKLKE